MGVLAGDVMSQPEVVASLNYLASLEKIPVFSQSDKLGESIRVDDNRAPRDVTIRNARLAQDGFSLDVEGFTLVEQATAVADFNDDAQLAEIYTPEVEALVAAAAGGTEAVVYDHTRRSTDLAHRTKYASRDPVPAPHSDYTDASAFQRMRDKFGDSEAEERLKGRFSIVNAWRSMTGTIEQWPLTVCDARSIDDSLLTQTRREAPLRPEPSFEYNRPSETRHAIYDPNHRWYWFPRMTRDEVLLFKNYDTRTDGIARYALHSAFEDPDTPDDPAPRETIETRAFVFYD
ncbi:MAG: methyltransferase [Alphaproteobacteria bacterium]|nr:methyltransferase [Alphaproteobacteria bacterium]